MMQRYYFLLENMYRAMIIFWLTCLVGYPRTSAPEPLFLLFFFSFFAPMFVTFAPTFVTFAPTFVAFAPTIVAFGPMFVAFAATTKFAWEHHQKIQNPYRKSVHILGFSVTKGSPLYAICDVLVNTCEGRVHALNPLCLSDFRRRCEGWTLVSCFIRMRERK